MKFTEITVHTTTEASELVADIFWNYSNYGVTVCDVNDVIAMLKDDRVIWDYVDESVEQGVREGGDVLAKCYVPLEDTDDTVKAICDDLALLAERSLGYVRVGSLELITREIEGDDWLEVWKKHFRPIKIGDAVICPEWIEYKAVSGEKVVLLDSNMAFGTGEHETTSMCLELMQPIINAGDVVLDVGCGSGILGISALKFGAKRAYMTDIDEIAVNSALHNAALNGVDSGVEVFSTTFPDKDVEADLVFANIMADVLCSLCDEMIKRVKRTGTLVLSGIIDEKRDAVLKRYQSAGMHLVNELSQKGWRALALRW